MIGHQSAAAQLHPPTMPFIPASLPPSQPSPEAWCFAFVQRDLLLPAGEPLANTNAYIRSEIARWAKVVKAAKIVVE